MSMPFSALGQRSQDFSYTEEVQLHYNLKVWILQNMRGFFKEYFMLNLNIIWFLHQLNEEIGVQQRAHNLFLIFFGLYFLFLK